jgi:fimbrial chaperone protein
MPSAALAAAQFSAEPLLLTLPADKRAASLTLGNRGQQSVTVQTELVSWNQDAGEDVYAPTRDLLVSPPIFSIPPAGTQIVRVGRLNKAPAPAREVAYRLKATEVPAGGPGLSGISTVMQLSFPVFVPPPDRRAAPKVEGTAEPGDQRSLRITLANGGLVHGKVLAVRVRQDGALLGERPMNYYVLAGAKRQMSWPDALKSARPGPAEVEVQLEGKNPTLVLPLMIAP